MAPRRAIWSRLATGDVVAVPAALSGAAVATASYVIGSRRGDVRVDVALASMAAFLFGLLVAFTIVRTRERLALVHGLVSSGDAGLLSIHDAMRVFAPEDRASVRDLIDLHLTDQIDYRLVDYHRANDSYERLTDAVLALRPSTSQQEAVYKELVGLCIRMSADRARIDAAGGQQMSRVEWAGLLMLLVVLLALISVLPGGTVPGAVVVGVLGATLVTMMILLRKLDLLRWHEQATIWEPTTRLFRRMGRDPYVPREVIDRGRYRPVGQVRVVEYPDPYPERSTKRVTVVWIPDDGAARPAGGGASPGPMAVQASGTSIVTAGASDNGPAWPASVDLWVAGNGASPPGP